MAKSPIHKGKVLAAIKDEKDNIKDLNMTLKLHPLGQRPAVYNLRDLCFHNCEPNGKLVKPSRLKHVKKIYNFLSNSMKELSDSTIQQYFRCIRSYLCFCDQSNYCFMTKKGFLAFAGRGGELDRQLQLADNPKPYLFLYEDGESMGLSEASIAGYKSNINAVLNGIGFDTLALQIHLHVQVGTKKNVTVPYTKPEWDLMLRRLSYYFYSLSSQLIAFRELNPESAPPTCMDAIIDYVDGEPIEVRVGQDIKTPSYKGYADGSPFTQCMQAGYLLFSYYTSLNATSILELRHPLIERKVNDESKTTEYLKIKAYKGRSSREIYAMFASISEREHSEWSEESEGAGYVSVNVKKKGTVGVRDGMTFIKLLRDLSNAYGTDKYGYIFYVYGQQDSLFADYAPHAAEKLSQNLGLYRSKGSELADYFIHVFKLITTFRKIPQFSFGRKSDECFRVVKKGIRDISSLTRTTQGIKVAWAAMKCLVGSEVELKGIVMPLEYSKVDDLGFVHVSFHYDNGHEGCFKIESKHINFLKKLSSFALEKNKLVPNDDTSYKPPYLLPLGRKGRTYQWSKKECLISVPFLMTLGIRHGDFLLDCSARKIRATNSKLTYSDDDKGFAARQILQHSPETQDRNYPNGHPDENSKMLSQGLSILAKIVNDIDRDDAVEEVKNELEIEVLEYDRYIKRNMPANPNGISCNSRPDLFDIADYHYNARKFAEKNGFLKDGMELPCYQYDLCAYCKSAQLVNDAHQIYKLLSFIEMLYDSIDLYPEGANKINKKIYRFESLLNRIPENTLFDAQNILQKEGRYFMFKSEHSVRQYISF